jgi:haloacetate dehalogenase
VHGLPQTHHCWHRVARALTADATVVVCDLKGYGASRAAPGGPLGQGYSNRERAAELVEVMAALGLERFAVVGHDRGGRVADRMALDHPGRVERLCVLNIGSTVEQFERMASDTALEYWPWFPMAQPAPFAEPGGGRRRAGRAPHRRGVGGGRARAGRPAAIRSLHTGGGAGGAHRIAAALPQRTGRRARTTDASIWRSGIVQ